MGDPEWGQPCNGDTFTIFGENFEVFTFGAACAIAVVNPEMRTPRRRTVRTAMFVGLALLAWGAPLSFRSYMPLFCLATTM